MSVSVSDLMALPSLKRAKVLAGKNSMERPVTCISVLESIDPGVLVEDVFPKGEYWGGEIVITGFLNCIDDIDRQCAIIRKLADGGDLGLIIYYVGVHLPKIDKRLIETADELDFILISMPENEPTLRYGEVINDVMGCIYRDRNRNEAIATELLAGISALPKHQQTMDTAVKMLSDRLSASVLLRGPSQDILSMATWPRSLTPEIRDAFETNRSLPESGLRQIFGDNVQIFREKIDEGKTRSVELIILKESQPLEESVLRQSLDAVKICLSIWGDGSGTHFDSEFAMRELVMSILNDEPMKMRQLGKIFGIDIRTLHEMWIFEPLTGDRLSDSRQALMRCREYLGEDSRNYAADVIGENLILFLPTMENRKDAEELKNAVTSEGKYRVVRCTGLETTTNVRDAWIRYKEHMKDAVKIFPEQEVYTLGELEFAEECRTEAEQGIGAVDSFLEPLKKLEEANREMALEQTLETLLLDCRGSLTDTSKRLFVHLNTIKYRLGKITELLGYDPTKMPESFRAYKMVAVRRLIR